MKIPEKYHDFKRNGMTCRYGIYGLSRDYYQAGSEPPVENREIRISLNPPKLKVMQTVITERCNLKCAYCSCKANGPKIPYSDMTGPELKHWTDFFNREIGESGLLLITGGEPEMYPEAVDHLAGNIRGKVIIFTNGTLTTRARLEKYRECDAGVLFSLDGDLEAHDAARFKKGGSFAEVDRALKMAQEMEFDFGISAVVGDHNIDHLPRLVEHIFEEYRPSSMGLNLPHLYGKKVWERMDEYTDALMEIFRFARKEGLFIDQINRRLAPFVKQEFRVRDCSAQGEKMVVYPGGTVHSCVNENSLGKLSVDWERQIPLNHPDCSDCFAIGICGGGCLFDGNAIYGAGCFDQRNCRFVRRFLEFLIWDFYDELGSRAGDRTAACDFVSGMLSRQGKTKLSVGHDTI